MLLLGLLVVSILSTELVLGSGSRGVIRLLLIGILLLVMESSGSSLLGISIVVLILSREHYMSVLLVVGIGVCILRDDLLSIYIGLELVGLCSYVLVSGVSLRSAESGLKYYIMGSVSSGLLLLGMMRVYNDLGVLDLEELLLLRGRDSSVESGLLLLVLGLMVKLGLSVSWQWLVEVYEGSVRGTLKVVSLLGKLGVLVVLWRVLLVLETELVIELLGLSSLIVSSVSCFREGRIISFIGYSSVGHVGLTLLGLSRGIEIGLEFYMLVYVTQGILLLMLVLMKEVYTLEDMSRVRGKYWKMSVTLLLLSLGGIPPLLGFIGKILVLELVILKGSWLVILIVVGYIVLSVYNYLRWCIILYRGVGSLRCVEVGLISKSRLLVVSVGSLLVLCSILIF